MQGFAESVLNLVLLRDMYFLGHHEFQPSDVPEKQRQNLYKQWTETFFTNEPLCVTNKTQNNKYENILNFVELLSQCFSCKTNPQSPSKIYDPGNTFPLIIQHAGHPQQILANCFKINLRRIVKMFWGFLDILIYVKKTFLSILNSPCWNFQFPICYIMYKKRVLESSFVKKTMHQLKFKSIIKNLQNKHATNKENFPRFH